MENSVLDSVFAEMAKQPATALEDGAELPTAPEAQPAQPKVVHAAVPPQEGFHSAPHSRAVSLPTEAPFEPPSRARVWFGRAWLAGCLLLAAYFALRAMPGSPLRQGSPPARNQQVSQPRTKPIEQVDIFDRVLGKNPLLSADDRKIAEPDPTTWRVLRLRMTKDSGKLLYIKLARSLSWIREAQVQEGKSFFLALPEMGALGNAEVVAIEPCPPLKPGKGNVVTGTFAHEADDSLITLRLSGGIDPIGVTANHPFWSEDRKDFVPVGQLQKGERVRTENGTAEVVAIATRAVKPGEMVYNLEVHGEHVYQVTAAGVLVHNNCPNLSGMSRADAHIAIRNAGYNYHGTTAGGYVRYRHPSGAEIQIRPNGEVIRLGPPVTPQGGGRPYHPRIDDQGNRIPTHSTGEFVVPLPGRGAP